MDIEISRSSARGVVTTRATNLNDALWSVERALINGSEIQIRDLEQDAVITLDELQEMRPPDGAEPG